MYTYTIEGGLNHTQFGHISAINGKQALITFLTNSKKNVNGFKFRQICKKQGQEKWQAKNDIVTYYATMFGEW